MITPAQERKISALQAKLHAAQTYDGAESLAVATCLEEYALYLRTNKIKLLEAANALARAELIRSKFPGSMVPELVLKAASRSGSHSRTEKAKSSQSANTKASSNASTKESRNANGQSIQSDDKKCPFCAELVKQEAVVCKHCKSDLLTSKKVSAPYAFSSADPVIIFRAEGPRPLAAGLLSCLIPGAGHIYIGEPAKGVILFFLFVSSVIFCPIMIGAILAPIIWICGVVGSIRAARKKRNRSDIAGGWY